MDVDEYPEVNQYINKALEIGMEKAVEVVKFSPVVKR